jgi:hypothetical protein
MRLGDAKTAPALLPAALTSGQYRLLPACHWQPFLLATLLLIMLVPTALAAQQTENLDTTVNYLISYVRESDVTFERNATRYSGAEAAQHLDSKYRHFRDDIDTPEKFIELCATGSLMTGKPYFIITAQGEQLPSSDWLHTVLAHYRLRNEH